MITRFGPPALFAPQPREAPGGAQFIGLRLLPAGNAQRFFESVLRLFEPVETNECDASAADEAPATSGAAPFVPGPPALS